MTLNYTQAHVIPSLVMKEVSQYLIDSLHYPLSAHDTRFQRSAFTNVFLFAYILLSNSSGKPMMLMLDISEQKILLSASMGLTT